MVARTRASSHTLYSIAKQLVVQGGIIILCANSHVCLQMHYSSLQDSAISFLQFCYNVHRWRFSGNLHITTIELAITFIYVTSVQIAYGHIACCKNAQHLHTKYSSPLTVTYCVVTWPFLLRVPLLQPWSQFLVCISNNMWKQKSGEGLGAFYT